MAKHEIAKQKGYNLSDVEIEMLCCVWTNTSTSVMSPYVDLSVPTDDWPNPGRSILIASQLDRLGLLEQHKVNTTCFRLTEAGEKLHTAFYE